MAFKALVASMPKLEAGRRDVDEQIARADRALQDAEKQHEEVTEPLYARRRQISDALSDASSAQAELYRTRDDADLRRELFDRATYMDEKARQEAENAERELTLEATDARREVAGRYRKDAEAARREVKRLDKAQADATKRREQIEHRMQLA